MIALSETCHGSLGAVQTWVSSGHLLRHWRAEERIKMMSADRDERKRGRVAICRGRDLSGADLAEFAKGTMYTWHCNFHLKCGCCWNS